MAYSNIKSVAIIGAGASGAITAAALHAENYFDKIRIFDRQSTAGGTWNYNSEPDESVSLRPGALPTQLDLPRAIPKLRDGEISLYPPSDQGGFNSTPIYEELTTNVPAIAMAFSDAPFAGGPFVPHNIPKQYIENYFSIHDTDRFLCLRTSVEDITKTDGGWKLTLRRHNIVKHVDEWWTETFDAVIFGSGHYSVPYIPQVKGLESFIQAFPGRIQHSKNFRAGRDYNNLSVLVIGNSASGHDVGSILRTHAKSPVYQSRRHPGRWDSDLEGVAFTGVVSEYLPSGRIVFDDGSFLDDVDRVIYCTGYKPSFPFWNSKANGGELWDYGQQRLPGLYLHTFLNAHPTIGFVGGLGLVLTFRSFEYQAVALARTFAGRSRTFERTSDAEKKQWESDRLDLVRAQGRKFHDVHPLFEFPAFKEGRGEVWEWFTQLSEIAGLPTLDGKGRTPPVVDKKLLWALEHQKKYPDAVKVAEVVDVLQDVRRVVNVKPREILLPLQREEVF